MLRPRALAGPVKWLSLFVTIVSVTCVEALSEAELDTTLHAKDHQSVSDKLLTKLRQQRGPLWHSENIGVSAFDTAREVLHLDSIERASEFGPVGIKKWLSIQNNLTVYALGLSEKGITLVTAHPPTPELPGAKKLYKYNYITKDFPEPVTAAAIFRIHHPGTSSTRVYAVVAYGGPSANLVWYRVDDDLLEDLWRQPMKEAVTDIAVAELSAEDLVLIVNTCTPSSTGCRPTIDIYQFHSSSIPNIKLAQSISLTSPVGPVSVGSIRDVVLLAIPVTTVGKVLLYRHVAPSKLNEISDDHEVEGVIDNLYGYFKQHHLPLDSAEVTQAVFFRQQQKTFLAVNGLSRAVYLVDDDLELIGCPVPLRGFGKVINWVVIPIPNYRQDVVLLAQYSLESTTEKREAPAQYSVAAFTFSNNDLLYQRDTYCYVTRSSQPEHGSGNCLLQFSNPTGIDGTAVLPLRGSSGVYLLVPRMDTASSLVGVYTKLVEAADPVVAGLDALSNVRNQLEAEIARQEGVIRLLEESLRDSLQIDGPNVITGDWNINEVTAFLVEVEDASSIKEPVSLSENMSQADLKVKLDDVQHEYEKLEKAVKEIKDNLRDVLLRTEDGLIELEGTLTVLAGLEVESESKFENLITNRLNGELVEALFEDTVRLDNLREITSHKDLPALDTNNVAFSYINNIPASKLIFDGANDQPINIEGSIHFENGLKTDSVELTGRGGKVNGVDIFQEVFVPSRPIPVSVSFEKVNVENVQCDLVNRIPMSPDYYYKYITWGLDQKSLNGSVLNSARVDGNVVVEYVNDIYWADLVNGLVWIDQPSKIHGSTSVNQVVVDGADTTNLNQLPFPGDFVLRTSLEHVVTGQKIFKGGLYAADVDAKSINDVNLNSIVTLHSNQNLPSSLTLSGAFIGSDIKVNSKLNGVNVAAINTPSPTLSEGGAITANVYFTNLYVDGPVVVSNSVENALFTDIISDIVVAPTPGSAEAMQPIVITGDKTIPSLTTPSLTVTTGLLNDLPVDGFVTSNTEQEFKKHINVTSHIEFGSVDVSNHWDGVNVLELKNNVMTLSGNQKTSTRLTFANPSNLWASRLSINELNDHLTDETVSVVSLGRPDGEQDVQLSPNGEAIVDGSLGAADIQVDGNVIVKGKACGVHLLEFEENRLSISKPQTISANMKIENVEVTGHLNVARINSKLPQNVAVNSANPPTDLEAGSYFVDELLVQGKIVTKLGVNGGVRLDEKAADAVRLDRGNIVEGNLIFTEPVHFDILEVRDGKVNGHDLGQIEMDSISNGQDVILKGETRVDNLEIFENLASPDLLGLNPDTLLMRDREQKISSLRVSGDILVAGDAAITKTAAGDVAITKTAAGDVATKTAAGDVAITKTAAGVVAITKTINGGKAEEIVGRYKKLGIHKHQIIGRGAFIMYGDFSADDLNVVGTVNGHNMRNFLASTIDKRGDSVVPVSGQIVMNNGVTFIKPVTVENSGSVSGVKLAEDYKNVVLFNIFSEINGKVIFEDGFSAGKAEKAFNVTEVVKAGTIYGCNVTDWYSDGIFINEDTTLQGNRSFDTLIIEKGSFLNASFLNAADMSKVILLNHEQTIDHHLNFAEITSNRLLDVGDLINGVNLKEAFKNTLLTEDDLASGQEIVGKTFTGPVYVEGNLDVKGGINGLDVSKAITLNDDQVITSPLHFEGQATAKSNVHTTEPISNINLKDWTERVVLTDSADNQTVTVPWEILGNVTFLENVNGNGALDGVDVRSLETMKRDVHNQIVAIRANLTDKWKRMCFEVKSLTGAARKQPFLLHQVDVVQTLESAATIKSIHVFNVQKRTFLFVSYRNNCFGALFEWGSDYSGWNMIYHNVINAGGISEWLTIPPAKSGPTYLVTSAEYNGLNCGNYQGHVWKFNRGLEHAGEIMAWTDGEVNPETREFYVMNQNKVSSYGMESGKPKEIESRTLSSSGPSFMVSRVAGDGQILTDGTKIGPAALSNSDRFVTSLLKSVKQKDHIALFNTPDGRRLAAVFEESSRSIMISDLDLKMVVGRISSKNARLITPLELGDALHRGQTFVAFLEEHNILRLLQYKGEQGFVDVARMNLPIDVFGMESVRLPSRGLLRERVFLVIRGAFKVLMLEVEMLGDPLPDGSPTCERNAGF